MKARVSPNIALIKYWGKLPSTGMFDSNIGTNPSISMTLSRAATVTEVRLREDLAQDQLYLNSQPILGKSFEKVQRHLDFLFSELGRRRIACRVISENNFPTGAGIASSASGFAALTLATLEALQGAQRCRDGYLKDPEGLRQLSRWSRIGSGSAARSVSGPFMQWDGQYAETLVDCDWKLYDTIVILSKDPKATSSSEGHRLAQTSPHFPRRLRHLPERCERVLQALKKRDIHQLGTAIEEEAREMHTIMESSLPPVIYQTPATRKFLEALERIPQRDFYWTLDAGPNPHIISERPLGAQLRTLLSDLDLEGTVWEDEAGLGPELLP